MSKPTQRDIKLAYEMYAPNPDWSKVPPQKAKVHTEKKRNKRDEDHLQMICVKYLRALPGTLVFSVPNHLYLGCSASTGARLGYIAKQKAMGMLSGVSDLIVIFRNVHGSTTVCLPELKSGKNTLSENQSAFADLANNLGCYTGVVRSLDDLIAMLKVAGHPYYQNK